MNPLLIVLIIFAVVILIVEPFVSRTVMRKLSDSLINRKLDDFDQLRNKPLVKYLVNSSNLFYLDLNRAMAGHDDKKVLELLKIAGKLRMSGMRKEDICVKCFYYFLSGDNKNGCQECYRILKELNPDNNVLDIIYDTFIAKGYKYLDEVLESFSDSPDDQKVSQASILAAMYENMGELKKAERYHKMSEDYLNKIKKR